MQSILCRDSRVDESLEPLGERRGQSDEGVWLCNRFLFEGLFAGEHGRAERLGLEAKPKQEQEHLGRSDRGIFSILTYNVILRYLSLTLRSSPNLWSME